jgi:DNA-binding transcriptional LysR family regulator
MPTHHPPALNEMALFAAVVAEGSFSAAARSRGIPKSSVSRRVAELEERLGVTLLERTTRKVTPTAPGARFYEHCARLVAEAEEARRAIVAAASLPVGLVRITAPGAFGTTYLGEIAAELLERYAELRLEIVLSNRVLDLVEEGLDIAIRIGKRPASSSFVARRVGLTGRLFCASPDYLARRGTPVTGADLAAHDLLVQGDSTRPVSFLVAGPSGERAAPARAGRLVRVLADHEPVQGEVLVVYPSRRHMPARVRAVLDVLVPRLRDAIARLSGGWAPGSIWTT